MPRANAPSLAGVFDDTPYAIHAPFFVIAYSFTSETTVSVPDDRSRIAKSVPNTFFERDRPPLPAPPGGGGSAAVRYTTTCGEGSSGTRKLFTCSATVVTAPVARFTI